MCWQCGSKPEEWLNIFESFIPEKWFFGKGTSDGVFQFVLEGERYHTNPDVDKVEWMVGAIPGEVDQDGVPWFLPGAWEGEQ
jgi:hypothetical protein